MFRRKDAVQVKDPGDIMSNLVFVNGDYCSGTTLLFTLFRKTERYYSLYEPLHEQLLEYLIWPMLPDDHHFFVGHYHSELKGFDKIPQLFDPRWGNSGLYLPPDARADALYRYLNYLIGTAFGRSGGVMLKENRFTFRMGWLRRNFPHAKFVHIYRRKEDQWKSILRRVQAHLRRENVGQDDVSFNGFCIAAWCEDLKTTFPELDARHSKTGYERFSKLWELSFAENQRYADISVDYWDLTHEFEVTAEKMWKAIGAPEVDTAALKKYVIPPEDHKPTSIIPVGVAEKAKMLMDRAGRKYARTRLRARTAFRLREKLAESEPNGARG